MRDPIRVRIRNGGELRLRRNEQYLPRWCIGWRSLENRMFQTVNVQCSVSTSHVGGNNSWLERVAKKEKRIGREREEKLWKRGERRKRDAKAGGREKQRAGGGWSSSVHELREYVFKASPLGMTGRNSEIQQRHHGIGPLVRPCPSVCSWFPLPLPRTHLIYGSVYAWQRDGGAGRAYRLPKVRERHNRV